MILNINSPPSGYGSGTPRMSLLREPCGRDGIDINFQIHSMEKEAYSSVLRAFIAQSDLLSWGKEGLITELRKELNVTDMEHGQLLVKINSDESIKRIREWQKGAHESLSAKVDSSGLVNDLVDYTPPKKRRPSHPPLSKSQKYVPRDQPNSETMPSLAQVNFRNNQQHVELAVFPSQQSIKVVNHNFHGPLDNRGGLDQFHSEKDFHISDCGKFKNCSDFIEIRATNVVIHEVERLAYGRKNPGPAQVEKAKSILREHERAILEVLGKLADLSNEDDSPDQLHFSNEELYGGRNRMLARSNFYGQLGRFHGYSSEGFYEKHSARVEVDVEADEDILPD